MGWRTTEKIHGDPDVGFGLTFTKHLDGDGKPRGYSMTLPHQCDQWAIAGDEFDPVGLDLVKARLEVFVADATAALWAVRDYTAGEQI